jgi:UDP-N-acetylmuramoylalanine--D-glutamate ligase
MKHVLVVGMARSGQAAARALLRQGARVRCTDLRADAPIVEGAEHAYGGHRREDFVTAERIVVSPGVPVTQPDLAAAEAAGVPVIGELGWAAEQLDCPVLAVSGTNGKSTTTHLLGQVCTGAGWSTFVGGNLGTPLSDAVGGEWDAAVVEVSSYQMERPGEFRPRAAAILNLTPDHLERHGTMDGYGRAKCRMFARMGPSDAAIVPAADPRLLRLADEQPGRRFLLGDFPGVRDVGHALVLHGVDDGGEVPTEGFALPGAHNRANLGAAVLLAACGGIARDRIRPGVLTGLPHRMQPVGVVRGVTYIDDSKATNVEAALAAYTGLREPVVALLGGRGKAGARYDALARALQSARAVVCFGQEGGVIAAAMALGSVPTRVVPRMVDAVLEASRLAEPGDAVVLSPACASFDEFDDFEHRGRVFSALVEELQE